MGIKYVLHKNPITSAPNDCKAAVIDTVIYDIDKLVEQITGEGSILKTTESVAVGNALLRQIGINLREGIGFHSKYFDVTIGMTGVFENEQDKYDSNRHEVYPILKASDEWRENIQKAVIEKAEASENKPKPTGIFDLKSKTNDQTMTPGGMAELHGQLLKIDETTTDEGLYFIPENGGSEIKVSYIYNNYPKSIQFEIPESLTAGNYKLEVRNRAHHGKTIRKGTLEFSLNVA